MAIKSSFPAKLAQVLHGAVVHGYSFTGKNLAAACEKHSAAIADLRKIANEGIESLRVAIESADDPATFGEAFRRIEAVKTDKVDLSQRALSLCMESIKLAEQVRDELVPKVPESRAFADKTVAKVKGQLEEIGSGPENMPAYSKNIAAVEKQFDHQVRFFNGYARGALEALKIAVSELEASSQQVAAKERAADAAKQLVHEIALKAINQ